MKRILFVDDEPHVLSGLQNLLRKQRHEWDMVFALGGDAALEELRNAPFDVVVSDMRMPGMDGAALLRHVQAEYPNIARIVLTGHAEKEAMVRALPVAHQFLSKPCDAEIIRSVIERTCALQVLLHDEAIRKIVGRLDKLPSVPKSYVELTSAVTQPDGSLSAVATIVEQDPAMAAKVLQLVNSGYFGLSARITSIQQAVVYLGLDLIQGLTLTAHVFATFNGPSARGLDLDGLQQHSVMTARLAKRLVPDRKQGDEAFAAAIVHDIGKIILALGAPDCWAEVVQAARATREPFHVVERERLGVTHAEIGAYLLGVWGVPVSIVEAVAYHHAPRALQSDERQVLAALHVSDAFVNGAGPSAHSPSEEALLDAQFIEEMGLTAMVPQWRAMTAGELRGMTRAR
jgi:putative nucleotidyltransferase with HDIG domain